MKELKAGHVRLRIVPCPWNGISDHENHNEEKYRAKGSSKNQCVNPALD